MNGIGGSVKIGTNMHPLPTKVIVKMLRTMQFGDRKLHTNELVEANIEYAPDQFFGTASHYRVGNKDTGILLECGVDANEVDIPKSPPITIIEPDANAELRERSGNIQIDDKLTSFLYSLMRDHLPAGIVEQLVREITESDTKYTNGWLANYANDLSKRLK
jgi:hypothetical protein